jgi:propionate CoA-transferase
MLQVSAGSRRPVPPPRAWRAVDAREAARLVPNGAVMAVEWLSGDLAAALTDAYRRDAQPRDLTVVYATARGKLRGGGLDRLAMAGLIRRVIGGQWYPVFGLRALADAAQIEAYTLPAAVIRRLFRDIADGGPDHASRGGVGTEAGPSRPYRWRFGPVASDLVLAAKIAGAETLMHRTFPVDVAAVSVALIAPRASLAVTREGLLVIEAAKASGGMVIAQQDRVGLLERLPRSWIEVPDTMVDVLVLPGLDRD